GRRRAREVPRAGAAPLGREPGGGVGEALERRLLAVVPARREGVRTVIDFHSHFFSRTFFEALARLSPQDGTVDEKLARVVERTGLELPDADDARHLERWMRMLDDHGVDHLVSFASAPPEAPVLVAAAKRAGGRITAFAMIDPTADGAAATAE